MNVLLAAASAHHHIYADNSTAKATLPLRIVQAAEERVKAKWYPSLVIAVVEGNKSNIVSFGKLDDGRASDRRTVYEIGSITKTFTAALLAQDILSGREKPDDSVMGLLPGFRLPSRDGQQISLASLATQFSGLPYMPDNLAADDPLNPFARYDVAKLKAFLGRYQLTRAPGAAYEYSNLGFGLLGFALTQPRSYGSVLHERILAPLGMKMSGVDLSKAMKAHLAPGHDRHNQPAEKWSFDVLAGCGAINSTAEDMLRYLKANMPGARTVLSPAFHLAQQTRRNVNQSEQIGFAWMKRKGNSQDIVWHNGTTFGYASFIGFTADGERGIVIMTNISESVDDLGFAALSDEPLRSYKTVPLDSTSLKSYEGVYKVSGSAPKSGLIRVFAQDGQVFAEAQGEEPLPLFAQSHDEFFTRIEGFHLIYRRNENGDVDSLILRQKEDRIAARLSGDEAASGLSLFPRAASARAAFKRQ